MESKKKKVLCIDGGGMRGLIPSKMIPFILRGMRIEEQPKHKMWSML